MRKQSTFVHCNMYMKQRNILHITHNEIYKIQITVCVLCFLNTGKINYLAFSHTVTLEWNNIYESANIDYEYRIITDVHMILILCGNKEWLLYFLIIISLRTTGQSCWFAVMCNLHLEEVTSHCYFRGVLPFGQRKRLWEKHRAKSRKHRPSAVAADIVCGSQVCMKNSPMYQPGAIGKYLITSWVIVR